jgi:uncharacterized protein (DUF1778 family)
MATLSKRPLRTKLTVRLAEDTMETVNEAVAIGLATSSNAFIDDSIRARAREVRHARLRKLADEAMSDPLFVKDMHETMAAFEPADRELWPAYDGVDAKP